MSCFCFMWTRRECRVFEDLLQNWQTSSGRVTCLASMCLVKSILLLEDCPHMLQNHRLFTLAQFPITKLSNCSWVNSTLFPLIRIFYNLELHQQKSCVWHLFMWMARLCLVFWGLLQFGHKSFGSLTCFDSRCLLTSILLKNWKLQMLHIHLLLNWSL